MQQPNAKFATIEYPKPKQYKRVFALNLAVVLAFQPQSVNEKISEAGSVPGKISETKKFGYATIAKAHIFSTL